MSHPYNTRFQAKLRAQAEQKAAQELQARKNSIRNYKAFMVSLLTPQDREYRMTVLIPRQMEYMVDILKQAAEENDNTKKMLIVTRLYQFLEHNYGPLQENKALRSTIREHANYFITMSRRYNTMKCACGELHMDEPMREAVLVADTLRESCERVLFVLDNL
jgi:hypothetical protein